MKQLLHLNARHPVLSALVLILSWFMPQAATAMTLTDAVNEALHANPKLLAAAYELEETRQRIRQAFAGYLPSIDFSMGKGREWINSPTTRVMDRGGLTMDRGEAGMNITQPIFDGFNTLYKVEQAEAQVRSADFSYQSAAESLTFDVAEAYLEVQKQRKLLKLATDTMTLHGDILIRTRKMAQLGITADMDVRQAESRVALIASDLAVTEGALRNADTRFISLVGFPPGLLVPPSLDEHRLPASRAIALEKAMNREASLLAANADLDAIRAESKATAATLWPKISLDMAVSDMTNAGGVRSYSQDASAMLRFKYNFYRGGADISKFKETSHKAARFREKQEQIRSQVEDKVNRSWNAILSSRARLQSLEKHVKVLEKVNQDHQEQYRLGTQSLLDRLNSENELHAAKRMWIEEEFRFITESCRLLSSMGMLKESLLQPDLSPTDSRIQPGPASATSDTSRLTPPWSDKSWPAADSIPDFTPMAASPAPVADNPPVPSATPERKPPDDTTSAASEKALSQAQEEAMTLLVDSLFVNESDNKPDVPQTGTAPDDVLPVDDATREALAGKAPLNEAPLNEAPLSEAPLSEAPASEALGTLSALLSDTAQSASTAISQALSNLTTTVNQSSEQTPKPTQPRTPQEGQPCNNDAVQWPDPLWESDQTDPLDFDPISLLDYMHIMTNDERSPEAELPPPDLLQYTIQVGAFQNESSAINLIGQLQNKGLELYLNETQDSRKQTWYLVWIGRYDTESEARKALQSFIKSESRPAFITPVARKGHSTLAPSPPRPKTSQAAPVARPPVIERYAVQVGGFSDPRETEKRLIALTEKGYNLYLVESRNALGKLWQTIWIGRYDDHAQAQAAAESFFAKEGEAAVVIEIQPDSPSQPRIISQIGNPA